MTARLTVPKLPYKFAAAFYQLFIHFSCVSEVLFRFLDNIYHDGSRNGHIYYLRMDTKMSTTTYRIHK